MRKNAIRHKFQILIFDIKRIFASRKMLGKFIDDQFKKLIKIMFRTKTREDTFMSLLISFTIFCHQIYKYVSLHRKSGY